MRILNRFLAFILAPRGFGRVSIVVIVEVIAYAINGEHSSSWIG